jgi:hypothetical protein
MTSEGGQSHDVLDPGPAPAPPENLPKDFGATPGDFAKLRYTEELQAWLESWKQQLANAAAHAAVEAARADAKTARDASRQDADRAAEAALVKSLHDAYVSVTQSSIDRSLTRTNVVTASISAVITIYTGLLALVYAAQSGSGKPLTAAAILPALFLGLALLLVTVYAAMFKNSSSERGPLLPSGVGGQLVEYRLTTFMEWCFATVGARTWALHAGIVSLGWGVASLPVPFVTMTGKEQVAILIVGLLLVTGTAAVTAYRSRTSPGADGGAEPDLPEARQKAL